MTNGHQKCTISISPSSTQTMRKILNVLIACEESQAECRAFRELGHKAFSCDIQPCLPSGNPYWHIQGDVTPLLHGDTAFKVQAGFLRCVPRWDLIIAHPPCTYLSKVSSPLMYKEPLEPIDCNGEQLMLNRTRYDSMIKGREFFYECLNANAPYVAVENPIPMRMARLPRPSCYAHPSWYGVKYTKKTCYWLKNLPPLMPTIEYPNPREFHRASRGKYRSRTFPQMAEAIAEQWSNYILNDMKRARQTTAPVTDATPTDPP